MSKGWIGVDLDGTLAEYHEFISATHIGEPIPLMVNRVKEWLRQGLDVRIFTARVDGGGFAALTMEDLHSKEFKDVKMIEQAIQEWCVEHIGQELPITNVKDYGMIELWDDRCIQVISNTGERVDQNSRGGLL